MKTLLLVLVTFFAAPTARGSDVLDEIRKENRLLWGGDQEGGGPYIFPRDDDPTLVQGFEVELANLLATKLRVTARFSQGQWEKLPDLLVRGDIDIVLDGDHPVRDAVGDIFGADAHAAEPALLSWPLCMSKILRSSGLVRFLLSVTTSTRNNVPAGPMPS